MRKIKVLQRAPRGRAALKWKLACHVTALVI